MAEIMLFKTVIIDLFKQSGFEMKYRELGINMFGAVPIEDNEDNHLVVQRKQEIQIESHRNNAQVLFRKDLLKQQFYNDAKQIMNKQQEIFGKEPKKLNPTEQYIKENKNEVLAPNFLRIDDDELVLVEQKLGDEQSLALGN